MHFIWPGPGKACHVQVGLGMEKLVRDVNSFWEPRMVHPECPPVRLLAALWTADGQGTGEILAMEGPGAEWGCHRCLFRSVRIHGRQIWKGHVAYLPANDPLREWFDEGAAVQTTTLRRNKEAIVMRQIVHDANEVAVRPSHIIAICGFKDLCQLDNLHGNCDTLSCVAIDAMHAIPNIMKNWIAMFKVIIL